jgi:hypothetical protein
MFRQQILDTDDPVGFLQRQQTVEQTDAQMLVLSKDALEGIIILGV